MSRSPLTVALVASLAAFASTSLCACKNSPKASPPPAQPASPPSAYRSPPTYAPTPRPSYAAPSPTYTAPRPSLPVSPPVSSQGPYAARDVSLDAALAAGRASGRPVALYFVSQHCGWCHRLETGTLTNASVQQEMAGFYSVRMDAEGPTGNALASRYGLRGLPTVVVLDGSGNPTTTIAGFSEPSAFVGKLRAAHH